MDQRAVEEPSGCPFRRGAELEPSGPGRPTSRGSLVGSHRSANHRMGSTRGRRGPLPPNLHAPHSLDTAFGLSCPRGLGDS
jgi:hypothetical protein